ncbi:MULTISPECIES: hypothetical protein [unclassified Anabaena]|uniref:hypothetical protein n=1 Tax=unclassified Anabaena TaxID=2619674 RepID=UPI0039C5B3D7
MSQQTISSELMMELSTDEQQMISGGQWGKGRKCPRRIRVPKCGFYFRKGGYGGGKYDDGGYDDGGYDDGGYDDGKDDKY